MRNVTGIAIIALTMSLERLRLSL